MDEGAYRIATSQAELKVDEAGLTAGARHLGEACSSANAAFSSCKAANGGDPKKCMVAGQEVTRCTVGLCVRPPPGGQGAR